MGHEFRLVNEMREEEENYDERKATFERRQEIKPLAVSFSLVFAIDVSKSDFTRC